MSKFHKPYHMLSISAATETMKLAYEIRKKDQQGFVYLICDPPQYLDEQELVQWMRETRDDDPDLYAEIVQAYFQLKKSIRKDE